MLLAWPPPRRACRGWRRWRRSGRGPSRTAAAPRWPSAGCPAPAAASRSTAPAHTTVQYNAVQYSTVQYGSCTHTTSASPRIKISFRFNLSTVNQSYVLSSPYHIRKEFDLIIDVHCLILVESYHVVVIIDNLFIVTLFLELLYTPHMHTKYLRNTQ